VRKLRWARDELSRELLDRDRPGYKHVPIGAPNGGGPNPELRLARIHMPQSAYVLLKIDGVVERTHSVAIGGGIPTASSSDLESLINAGFVAKRELALSNGKVLLVLEKP